jgi:hypothetical protein
MLAQCEVVATHLDLNGIAQGREADKFDRGADEQAHFHEARTFCGREVDLGDGSPRTDREGGKRLGRFSHDSGGLRARRQGLDENAPGQFRADAEPRVADLADHGIVTPDDADLLILAETHLAQAMGEFGGSVEAADFGGAAGLDLVQRAQVREGALRIRRFGR